MAVKIPPNPELNAISGRMSRPRKAETRLSNGFTQLNNTPSSRVGISFVETQLIKTIRRWALQYKHRQSTIECCLKLKKINLRSRPISPIFFRSQNFAGYHFELFYLSWYSNSEEYFNVKLKPELIYVVCLKYWKFYISKRPIWIL